MALIEFSGVSKSFARNSGRQLLRGYFRGLLKPAGRERFFALRNVSFRIEAGESVAFIGPNGAGKSTLLGLVAQLAEPDQGAVQVNGRVAALLELGSGFHPDLTGRENLHLNASLLGLGRKEVARSLDRIVDFSGIADFIDQPLRTYSTGMVMRLAFSVAVNVDPDILITDEVLAVGDQEFQTKCFQKMAEFQRAGKSLLFVSHATNTVVKMCRRAVWLDHGKIVLDGKAEEVVAAYEGHTKTPC